MLRLLKWSIANWRRKRASGDSRGDKKASISKIAVCVASRSSAIILPRSNLSRRLWKTRTECENAVLIRPFQTAFQGWLFAKPLNTTLSAPSRTLSSRLDPRPADLSLNRGRRAGIRCPAELDSQNQAEGDWLCRFATAETTITVCHCSLLRSECHPRLVACPL